MHKYQKQTLHGDVWIITDAAKDPAKPQKAVTFAFDTENIVLLDGKQMPQNELFRALQGVPVAEMRQRLTSITWAWQCYDEVNGFFMTNDFDAWLEYQCRCGYKFGWCYNAKFDFSQIDYKILAEQANKWKPHRHSEGAAYNKNQPWTYESIHNDMGARYAYKLWIPYKSSRDRHKYCHSVDYRDFMNIFAGGLARTLKSLDVKDNDGNEVRKLEMEYQQVNPDELTDEQIDYCKNDVKGLYFAIKIYNESIEAQSNGESHIFGKDTNIMTAGGFAKAELLRSMYPNIAGKSKRMKAFQYSHPIDDVQDKWIRQNHLYRGGISFVNPAYKGKLLNAEQFGIPMHRYDVNSEYPYAMSAIRDLIGKPKHVKYYEYLMMQDKDDYECIMILNGIAGEVKAGYLGFWFDPFKNNYVNKVNENGTHLIFERELDEMCHYYDFDVIDCTDCIIIKRGDYAYKPYVDENYALKAQAKKDGNAGLQACAKLKLNSSYGKLAERCERNKGHYEKNEETGCIHYVPDVIETTDENGITTIEPDKERNDSTMMNVIIGALVTSVARCWILSHIREICKDNQMSKLFVYIDTDSIHAFADYDKADAYKLGGLKLEAKCPAVKYILPKTYVDVEAIDENGIITEYEAHSKGINVSAMTSDFDKANFTIDYLDKHFEYGAKYQVLTAMNVKGGKVLVPVEKYLATPEQNPEYFTKGYDKQIYYER